MQFNTDIQGSERAGGWRYPYSGPQTSSETFYAPMGYDAEKLKRVSGYGQSPAAAAPQGLLDQVLANSNSKLDGLLGGGTGGDYGGDGGKTSGRTGIGIGTMTDAIDAGTRGATLNGAVGGFAKGGVLGAMLGGLQAGLGYESKANAGVLGAINASPDAIASLNAVQNWGVIDQGYMSKVNDPYSNLVAYDGKAALADEGTFTDQSDYGGGGPSSAPSSDSTANGGLGSDSGMAGSAYAKGGKVTAKRLTGPNPKGKDDGYGALDAGEFVLTAKAASRFTQKQLNALLDGRATIVMNRGE